MSVTVQKYLSAVNNVSQRWSWFYFEMVQFLDEFQRIYASWDNPSFMVNKRKENISCYFTVLHRMSQLILVQKI